MNDEQKIFFLTHFATLRAMLDFSGRITRDIRLQPSAFTQILATLGLLIVTERYPQ
jgi:hypothetical protein